MCTGVTMEDREVPESRSVDTDPDRNEGLICYTRLLLDVMTTQLSKNIHAHKSVSR